MVLCYPTHMQPPHSTRPSVLSVHTTIRHLVLLSCPTHVSPTSMSRTYPVEALDGRCLACAVGPKQRKALALRDAQPRVGHRHVPPLTPTARAATWWPLARARRPATLPCLLALRSSLTPVMPWTPFSRALSGTGCGGAWVSWPMVAAEAEARCEARRPVPIPPGQPRPGGGRIHLAQPNQVHARRQGQRQPLRPCCRRAVATAQAAAGEASPAEPLHHLRLCCHVPVNSVIVVSWEGSRCACVLPGVRGVSQVRGGGGRGGREGLAHMPQVLVLSNVGRRAEGKAD